MKRTEERVRGSGKCVEELVEQVRGWGKYGRFAGMGWVLGEIGLTGGGVSRRLGSHERETPLSHQGITQRADPTAQHHSHFLTFHLKLQL